MKTEYNIDQDGIRYWHIAQHGKETLWRHMNDAQKVAISFMEKLGWALYRLDSENFRQAYLMKSGEMNMTIGRK